MSVEHKVIRTSADVSAIEKALDRWVAEGYEFQGATDSGGSDGYTLFFSRDRGGDRST